MTFYEWWQKYTTETRDYYDPIQSVAHAAWDAAKRDTATMKMGKGMSALVIGKEDSKEENYV